MSKKKSIKCSEAPMLVIGVVHSKYPDVIKSWMDTLARNKKKTIKDMALLSVKVKPYTKYYLDDTATIDNKIISAYTMASVPSTEIEILIP